MTNKIPIIENLGTNAEHLTTVSKAKPEGNFPFDDLIKPGLTDQSPLRTSEKMNQLNFFQNQNRTEEGKRTPLKAKPILDTSKLKQEKGGQTQPDERVEVKASAETPAEPKRIETKNTKENDSQVLENEGDRPGNVDAQIRENGSMVAEVTASDFENAKDPEAEDVVHLQAVPNSAEVANKTHKNEALLINPIPTPIEKNPITSEGSAVNSQLNLKKAQTDMNVSRRNPFLDIKYPARHTGSPTLEKNTAIKPDIHVHDMEKRVGRPAGDVSTGTTSPQPVSVNRPSINNPEYKDQAQTRGTMSTLARTIVASVSPPYSNRRQETVSIPQNHEIRVDTKAPNIFQAKSGQSDAPAGLKPVAQSSHPLNPIQMPDEDGTHNPVKVESEVKNQNSHNGSDPRTHSSRVVVNQNLPDALKDARSATQRTAPVQNMTRTNSGIDEGRNGEIRKSIPPVSASNNEQLQELKAKQEATTKMVDVPSVPRMKQEGQKTLDRNPVATEAKNESAPALKYRGDEAAKPAHQADSRERLNQEVKVQAEKIIPIQNDSMKPESSDKLIPDAAITTSLPSKTADKPKKYGLVKSVESRHSTPAAPGQHLRSKRSEHMQQSYGVESLKESLSDNIEKYPSDRLKEQLRDRIEFLKKAQASIHQNPDDTPNQHRNHSVKSPTETGLMHNQNSVLPHPRVNAPLFARSFAGEMVEKIRGLTEKMDAASNDQKPTFTVNGGAFGELDIEFDLEKSSEQITIYVDDELSKTELQRVLPNIEDNLLQRGYNFTGLEVEVRNQHKDSEAMARGKQKHSPHGEDKTAPLPQGENEDKRTNTNRNYGYNTMEVVA